MFGKQRQEDATSYGIIGMGRFGSALACTLAEAGKEILVLDQDEEKVRRMRSYTEHAYVVRDLQKETLQETGIQNCDQVIVCIGDKVDVSILTTLNVINLGVPHVVAKANSPEQGEILKKIGAEVVYPERDMAIRLAKRLISGRVFNLFELDERTDISELKGQADAQLHGARLCGAGSPEGDAAGDGNSELRSGDRVHRRQGGREHSDYPERD